MSERFPVGGPRQPVYDFMRQHDFIMSYWSDKEWVRQDCVAVVYGSGSCVRVMRNSEVIADGPLDETIESLASPTLRKGR